MVGTWLGEIRSCSCLAVLSDSAWVLLNKIYQPFFTYLYKFSAERWRLRCVIPRPGSLWAGRGSNFQKTFKMRVEKLTEISDFGAEALLWLTNESPNLWGDSPISSSENVFVKVDCQLNFTYFSRFVCKWIQIATFYSGSCRFVYLTCLSIKIKLKIFPSREILCSSLSDFEAGESLIQSDVSCFQGRSSADLDRTERNRNGLSFEKDAADRDRDRGW